MKKLLLLLLLCGTSAPATSGDDPFAATDAVDDSELASIRGGFTLPNGVDVALTVRIDTVVDGSLVLRTVFEADTGPARLSVYAPAPGQSVPASTGMIQTGGSAPVLILDRAGGTISVQAGLQPTSAGTVSVGSGASPQGNSPPHGLLPLAITVGGPGVQTAAGVVSLQGQPVGTRIMLDGPNLDIVQLVGRAFGTVVANTGNNRTIDSVTTINLDLRGVEGFATSTAALRGQDIALDAVSRMRF